MTETLRDPSIDTHGILGEVPGIVYRSRCDEARTLDFVSRPLAVLCGGNRDTLPRSLNACIHAADVGGVRDAVAAAMRERRDYAVDYRLVAGPREQWVRDSGRPHFDAWGKPSHLSGMLLPIDAPAKCDIGAEPSILGAVINAIPDAIYFKSPDGVFLGCNVAFARSVGRAPQDITGRTDTELFPLRAGTRNGSHTRTHVEGSQSLATEMVQTRPDGRVAHVELLETPCRASDGSLLGAIGIARDVTERALTEALLHMVANDEPLLDVLDALLRFVESQAPEALASILLPDAVTQRLATRAAPSLPEGFTAEARDFEIGNGASSSAAICLPRRMTIVTDIASDPLWAGLRDAALRFGLRACCTKPILGPSDELLGAMVIYFREPRAPDDTLIRLADVAVRIAAIAIERSRTMRALQDSSTRLAALVDSAMDAIITVDASQHVVLFNAAAERMFGIGAQQALGKPLADFLPLRSRDRHDRRFREFAARQGKQGGLRNLGAGLRANGEEFPIEASISRTVVGGELLHTAIVRDVTERHDAEQAMRDALARFEAVIEATPMVAIQGMARDGTLLHWNAASTQLYGISAEQAIGRRLTEVMNCGQDGPTISAEIEHVWDSGVAVPPHEWSVWRLSDNRRICLVSTLFPVFENGRVSEVFCMDVDITERKAAELRQLQLNDELEERVRSRTAELQAANRELESFSYSVSHDLRAPLRGIDGFAQVLLEDYGDRLDATGHQHLQRIRGASQRMAALIDDLLMLAQISRSEVRWQTADLSEIASRWLVHLAALDAVRKVDWRVEPGLHCQGDPPLLELVLQNLLDNAWKFTATREIAHITFGRGESEGRLAYFVRDDGVGFDPAYAERLFAPFQRLHHAGQFPGTGIGLATVQRIVSRHGGRVWAESAPERGATFWFTLG